MLKNEENLENRSSSFSEVKTFREMSSEDFPAYWKLFTPIEQDIIKMLTFVSSATTVQDIRETIIANQFYEIIKYYNPQSKRISFAKPTPNFKPSSKLFYPADPLMEKKFDELDETVKKELHYDVSSYKYMKLVEKFQRETGNKVPSFILIEKSLKNLEIMSLVVCRPSKNYKATKGYWALNPKFFKFVADNKIYEHWKE